MGDCSLQKNYLLKIILVTITQLVLVYVIPRDLNKALSEAYRVLKPGGRYLCLEFSKIQNSNLDFIYKNYSKLIPLIGKAVTGQKEPYEYLVKSIEGFINQEELIDLMKENKFENCSYKNLSGGIVAIHSGWKI